jgi:hypothetical protein
MLKNRVPVGGAAIGSLVAIIACMSATGASANLPRVKDQDLAARVAAVAKSIREDGPAQLQQSLPTEVKVAFMN